MKKIALTLFLLCFIFKTNSQNIYDDALTAASYAYAHSKKAHGANNVFHTQEYADKAIEAFQKVEGFADECGCKVANETAYKARVDMESSLEQDTYERSRYFAKRAKELGSELLKQLTSCQANGNNYTDEEIAYEKGESELAQATLEVANKQKELQQKHQQLKIEQQKLEEQIAEQNRMKAEFEAKRTAELKAQSLIKSKAEVALQKLENALQELSIVLNEESKFESQADDYIRSENDLKNESLDDTKTFYVNRAKELTQTAMQQFAGYNMVEN
jgi:actin-related protein